MFWRLERNKLEQIEVMQKKLSEVFVGFGTAKLRGGSEYEFKFPGYQRFDDKLPGPSNGISLRVAKMVLKYKVVHFLHLKGCGTMEKLLSASIDLSPSLVSMDEK